MSLQGAFPPELQKQYIRSNLLPGAVIRFDAKMDDGRVHTKRFIVLSIDDNTLTVVINSEINQILQTPELLVCQVTMPVAQHPFMARDSNIDCSRIRSFDTEDLVRLLIAEHGWHLGKISIETQEQMLAALKLCRTESPRTIGQCCRSLEAANLS